MPKQIQLNKSNLKKKFKSISIHSFLCYLLEKDFLCSIKFNLGIAIRKQLFSVTQAVFRCYSQHSIWVFWSCQRTRQFQGMELGIPACKANAQPLNTHFPLPHFSIAPSLISSFPFSLHPRNDILKLGEVVQQKLNFFNDSIMEKWKTPFPILVSFNDVKKNICR